MGTVSLCLFSACECAIVSLQCIQIADNLNRYGMIYAYLRASTKEQNASRAIEQLTMFATCHGKVITSFTLETISGTKLERPKLMQLLDTMKAGDVLLIEQVDRLTRLNTDDWTKLRAIIDRKGIIIVSLDLPTSHTILTATKTDAFTATVLKAINALMLEMLAAISRKDYEDRRRRQAQGIANNLHKFTGRPINTELHKKILRTLSHGHSQRNTAAICKCSLSTVQRVAQLNK